MAANMKMTAFWDIDLMMEATFMPCLGIYVASNFSHSVMFDFLKASLWGIQFGLVLNADPAEYGYTLLNLHTPVTNCVTVFKFHFDKYNFGNIKQELNKYEMPYSYIIWVPYNTMKTTRVSANYTVFA
jgi:hypothetical protein